MFGSEGFQPVERPLLLEHGRIGFEREGGVENAGTAASRLLLFQCVRRTVGAEEEFGRSRYCSAAHGEAMRLAFGDRQAIGMGAQASVEDGVAVDDQVLRGDRR